MVIREGEACVDGLVLRGWWHLHGDDDGAGEIDVSVPKRPILRYHGGKWRLAPWIVGNMPAHRVYVEPFGGAASVLLRKQRSYAEIYNDLDGEIVNLFAVLRDPAGARVLEDWVRLTPFARDEFELSYEASADPVEQARRTLVRCGMGFGSSALSNSHKTGFRGSATRSGTHPGTDWGSHAADVLAAAERFRGVIVENRDALKLVSYHDGAQTLFYCDPPYVHETRTWMNAKDAYRHEMTDDDHRRLAEVLHGLRGMVMLSGYPSGLYDELYGDWKRLERDAMADCAQKRVECLWFNAAAWKRRPQMGLAGMGAVHG